jgi:replicative DNA helicase
MLNRDDFYNIDNLEMFDSLTNIMDVDGTINPYLLSAESRYKLEHKETIIYLSDFFLEDINKLQTLTKYRRLNLLGKEVDIKIREERTPLEIKFHIDEVLDELKFNGINTTQEGLKTIENTVRERFLNKNNKTLNVFTGFETLDKFTGGFMPHTYNIFAGDTAQGKSTLFLNILQTACDDGKKVLFVNKEMSDELVAVKLYSAFSGISSDKILNPYTRFTPDEVRALEVARDKFLSYQLKFCGSKYTDVFEIEREYINMNGADIIMIDYLQLLDTKEKGSEYEKVTNISRNLKKLSNRIDAPLFVISSLSRSMSNRDDKTPQLSDLRGSGNIELDADKVLFLYRESRYVDYDYKCGVDEEEYKSHVELIIAKNRWGEMDKKIDLYYNGAAGRFREVY